MITQPTKTPATTGSKHYDNWWRTLVVAVSDALCWPAAAAFTVAVESGSYRFTRVALLVAVALVVQGAVGCLSGLYRRRYLPFSFEEIGVTGLNVGLTGVAVLCTDRLVSGSRLGHTIVWITATAGSLVLTLRYARRLRARWVGNRRARTRLPVLVVGAGEGAQRAIRAMLTWPVSPYRPVAMLDDDVAKRRLRIMGVRVLGRFDDLARVARQVHAQAVVLALPSAETELLRRLHTMAERAGLQTLVLPPVQHLVGIGSVAELRTYTDEDVLQRHMASIDMDAVRAMLTGQRVLVTGAGGSIGSELSRQISQLDPRSLVLLDHDDSLLHAVHQSVAASPAVVPVLADIRDAARITEVFATHRPQVVFHSAALKHLPALEAAPAEGWKTNVLGSRNVLAAAEAAGVECFVNISTDKAAEPISVLGHTKRLAEQLTAAVAERTHHCYVSVRFGNVIGSRGSVIETFQSQIDSGGPVTVTHADATRFFMAIREAVRLTLQAATVGAPGETLVLDMGAPVKIVDIARQLIEQSGRQVEITFIGLRPGEKLHEVMLSAEERATRPHHPLIDHVMVTPLWPDFASEHGPSMTPTTFAASMAGYAPRSDVDRQEAVS